MIWIVIAVSIALAILAAFWWRGSSLKRTPAEVAKYLRDFIEGTGGERDWDDFESVPIADPELERIRREAAQAAPPDPDMERLRELLRQAEDLAS